RNSPLLRCQIDHHNSCCASDSGTLYSIPPDTTGADDNAVIPGFRLRCMHRCTITGRNSAAKQGRHIKWDIFWHDNTRGGWHNRKLCKRTEQTLGIEPLVAFKEAWLFVALLHIANFYAQVWTPLTTKVAKPAAGTKREHNMISRFN